MQDRQSTNNPVDTDSHLEQLVREALLHDVAMPDTDAEWRRLTTTTQPSDSHDEARGRARSRRPRLVALWAAAAAVAAVVAVVTVLHHGTSRVPEGTIYLAKDAPGEIRLVSDGHEQRVAGGNAVTVTRSAKVQQCSLVVPEGKDARVTLADGTRVWVNANSRLSYPTRFEGDERRVSVEGEAYFEVAHDAAHPFIVEAGGVETRVLGTRFNVSTHGQQPQVALAEGSVRVTAGKASRVIAPGEEATLAADGRIEVGAVDVDDIVCWTEGIELFDDATLEQILMQMGAWYNMGVVCHNRRALADHMRYMYDRNAPVGDAVAMLNKIAKVKVSIDNNNILVE